MSRYRPRRLLLDTNIALDLCDSGRPQHKQAVEVVRRCNGGGDMGFIASVSLKDLYYVLCKQYGKVDGRKALEYVMGLLIVAPLGAEECDLSFHGDEPDFEDGLIRAYAELNDIDFIITRDAAAFQHSTVRAIDCMEYLRIVGA